MNVDPIIVLSPCELQYNYISETNCDVWRTSFRSMLRFARTMVNPWRILCDGVVIACSYDGFTLIEQAAANGRVEA